MALTPDQQQLHGRVDFNPQRMACPIGTLHLWWPMPCPGLLPPGVQAPPLEFKVDWAAFHDLCSVPAGASPLLTGSASEMETPPVWMHGILACASSKDATPLPLLFLLLKSRNKQFGAIKAFIASVFKIFHSFPCKLSDCPQE